MHKRLIGVAAMACAWVAHAQEIRPFAAVSVKECGPNERAAPSISSPATLSLGCYDIRRLISQAYYLFEHGRVETQRISIPFPIEGLPGWAASARFSIDAKTDGPVSGAMMRGPMMQRLLEERFHLKAHRETREGPVYVLTAPNGAKKLKASTADSCDIIDPTDFQLQYVRPAGSKPWCMDAAPRRSGATYDWDIRGISMEAFSLRFNPGRPIVNRTGLTGLYDLHLTWAEDPPEPQAGGATAPTDLAVFRAIREQLGLEIRPGTGTREYFVIDYIERPTGN